MHIYFSNRDYTRPDLPTCESDIVSQPSASGPVMPDISAAIAGKQVVPVRTCKCIIIIIILFSITGISPALLQNPGERSI